MKKYLTLLFIIFLSTDTNAQFLRLGFRLEPALLLTESNSDKDFGISPYSLYLTTTITPLENFSLEVRPGYFIAGEYYGGFEIGAFVKWSILDSKYFVVGGINNHSNTWLGSHNGGSGLSKTMVYKGIGIGYQKDSKLSFDITYYWTNDKVYSYSRYFENGEYNFRNNEMNAIIKIAFALSFGIIE